MLIASFKPNALMLGQDNAEAIMRAHLAKLGVHVEYGTALQDFSQDDTHVVAHAFDCL